MTVYIGVSFSKMKVAVCALASKYDFKDNHGLSVRSLFHKVINLSLSGKKKTRFIQQVTVRIISILYLDSSSDFSISSK